MSYKHIIMGDTDSCYCRLDLYAKKHSIDCNKEEMVILAEKLKYQLKISLPDIISKQFITESSRISILEAGREVVASSGLFKNKKKRYALHVVDDEEKAVDKLKIMGMETKRSDTPKFIQVFLTNCIERVVKKHETYDDLYKYVAEFRKEFRDLPPWKQGSPGRVKNLKTKTNIFNEWKSSKYIGDKKPQMHFMVKAAMNTNTLIEINNEHRWGKLRDGDKIEVIYLKKNIDNMDCVAIATDQLYIPEWFKVLPFDIVAMENKLLDKKLFNVIGEILQWDFTPDINYAQEVSNIMDDFYE